MEGKSKYDEEENKKEKSCYNANGDLEWKENTNMMSMQ